MAHLVLWKNVTHPFEVSDAPEREGYVNVWEDDLKEVVDPSNHHGWASYVWSLHNRDDRPTGQICPGASIGDIVQVDDTFLLCARVGWLTIPCPDGGRADRPRTAVGCAFIARTSEEYEAAETSAKALAREIGLEVRI